MNENKIFPFNTRKIKARKSNLRKRRGRLLALIKKSSGVQRPKEDTTQKSFPKSPIVKDITPWDDDESEIFSN